METRTAVAWSSFSFSLALVAAMALPAVAAAGGPSVAPGVAPPAVCGGFAGILCSAGQFCRLDPGHCCCDYAGVCVDLPQACPLVYDPVCGCDGRTYGNACEAAVAGVSIDHRGPCGDPREVHGVRFGRGDVMLWRPVAAALGYNVYKKIVERHPPEDFGHCLYTDVPATEAPIPGRPRSGELWLLEVTALFREGEGPMGPGSDGVQRKPEAPCTCTLPADPGPCDAAIPRWYHDFFTDTCETFIWGGCGGNANNFTTQKSCEAACTASCVLPPDPGPCDAAIPRWFFSGDTGRCWRFVWGGCGGNANNFESFDKCQDTCVCSLPADVGPCDGAFPRWYYETHSASCEPFSWGGCGGNANNFVLEPDCRRACTDVCGLPADTGPCLAVVPRWFFDDRSGRCERFVWGGCGGNGNNFETWEDCAARCPSTGPP